MDCLKNLNFYKYCGITILISSSLIWSSHAAVKGSRGNCISEILSANAILNSEYLYKAPLMNVDLRNADIFYSNLPEAVFQKADLSGAAILESDLKKAIFKKAILKYAVIYNTNLEETDFSNADFTFADIYSVNLKKSILRKAIFKNTTLIKVDLSGADLSGADLSGADLSGAKIDDKTIISTTQLALARSLYKIDGLSKQTERLLHEANPKLFEEPEMLRFDLNN
jgi:uncharacterized protein YjbI with pentapeptide repeats